MQYLGLIFLSITLLHSVAFAESKEATAPSISKSLVNQNFQKEPLMASHLRPELISNLKSHAPLTYATGHKFYDTPVVLTDDEGHKIDHKFQYDHKKQYNLVSMGKTEVMSTPIWFFSTSGEDVEELNYYSCTFEYPCRQLTPAIVKLIQSYNTTGVYWFASGNYDLPVSTRKNNSLSKAIDLDSASSIMGRSEDFLYSAYDDERPLINGSFRWFNFNGHDFSGTAAIYNIRMETLDNPIETIGDFKNTNLYSNGGLAIIDSELSCKGEDVGNSHNVIANAVIIYNSKLKISSQWGTNIDTNGYSQQDNIYYSSIEAKGSFVYNFTGTNPTTVFLNTDLMLIGQGESIAINHSHLNFYESSITAKGNGHGNRVVGINSSNSIIDIDNSSLNISGNKGPAWSIVAFMTDTQFIAKLNGTTIKVSSDEHASILESNNYYSEDSQMIFNESPSLLSVSSPKEANLFYLLEGSNPLEIINSSEPPSQCFVNDAIQECDTITGGNGPLDPSLMKAYKSKGIKSVKK